MVKNIREFFILLLLFSLMTYFILFFKRQENLQILDNYNSLSEFAHNNRYSVTSPENGVCLRLPIENYLVGALAASVPTEYEPELLKAQAILLRSTLCHRYNKEKTSHLETEETAFWSDRKMQSVWGENYEDNVKKCLDAVVQTQGIYLAYNNEPIEGFFHGMSAGRTRSGEELSCNGEYSYLRVTDCPDNLSGQDFEKEIKVKTQSVGGLEEAVRNEAGYVIFVQKDGVRISGEKLREELGLQSSNVTWKTEGEEITFRTKGKGHGFGLDQYYGNVLAKKGKDYREILEYFFADITYCRME